MRLAVAYFVSNAWAQFLPNGMPIPAHLIRKTENDEERPPSHVLIPELGIITHAGNAETEEPFYPVPGEQPETLSFEDFEFEDEQKSMGNGLIIAFSPQVAQEHAFSLVAKENFSSLIGGFISSKKCYINEM